MSTRYDERDDDRYAERDQDASARRDEYDYDRDRYERGGYGPTRNYTRYGTGRDYGPQDYDRATDMRDPGYERQETYGGYDRDYGRSSGRDYERESDYGRGSSARDYGRAYRYAQDYGRDYERDERDYYAGRRARSYDDERGPRGYEYDARRSDWTLRRHERDEARSRDARGRERERNWWNRVSDEVASWFGDEAAERRRLWDERQRGANFRGRGPRAYRRSDERIQEDINDRLTDHPYLDATDIEVMVDNGEVTLDGTVDSRQAKRLAEDVAESVSGVTNVENRLRVRRGAFDTIDPNTTGTDATETKAITGTTEPPKDTTTTNSAANAPSTGRSKTTSA